MKILNSISPENPELLQRPRIDALFSRAVNCSLVTVVAGPGYGKTQAIGSFIKTAAQRCARMHFRKFDDIPARFWRNFTNALKDSAPELSDRLFSLGFPEGAAKCDAALCMFAEEARRGAPILLIIDDYPGGGGHIAADGSPDTSSGGGSEVDAFLEALVGAGILDVHLILSGRREIGVGRLDCVCDGGLFQITAGDLAFTDDEIGALFSLRGQSLSIREAHELGQYTDGWPLALYLLSLNPVPKLPAAGAWRTADRDVVCPDVIGAMFEKDFFTSYDERARLGLIGLSLISDIPAEMIRRAPPNLGSPGPVIPGGLNANDAKAIAEALNTNLFVSYDRATRLYSFHHMYRAFLAEKQSLLTDEDKNRLWLIAGEAFLARGSIPEAIDCLMKCARYDRVVEAICRYFSLHAAAPRELAGYFEEKLSLLPQEFCGQNPLVRYMQAAISLNNLDTERAYTLLCELEAKLHGRVTQGERGGQSGGPDGGQPGGAGNGQSDGF
ncbi:MAG: hypothetical protein LBU58_01085, partial [Clostridiales bacterium]|nr:hypothetical protein [Clostridiales bacterium]